MTRLRRLIGTALVDSFGLSLGWTVFSLYVVGRHGLAGLGLCNAAMLVGVALSAPVAARLSVRLDGRALLRVTCVTESVLRVGTFALLLAGAPLVVVAVAVAASNVVAWTGYAGMRAEVAAADPRGAAMTWYMVAVAAIEAAGTATAALLPTGPAGLVSGGLLVAVIAGYGACLVPTWLVAGGALVARATPPPRAGGLRAVLRGGRLLPNGPPNGLLAFGGMVTLQGRARPEQHHHPPEGQQAVRGAVGQQPAAAEDPAQPAGPGERGRPLDQGAARDQPGGHQAGPVAGD
ncbi:MAG TPA: hypothetical protein VG499_08725, partial [Actinomycetota bacterium]|nr:hypothetical protein [Actinomycetota bacterium]